MNYISSVVSNVDIVADTMADFEKVTTSHNKTVWRNGQGWI